MAITNRAELDALLRERLATDPQFRERLITDPRATLGELLGNDVPEFIAITVHEESLTDVHLVIPAAASDEIDEEDLDLAAGGALPQLCILCTNY
jgi:hypothetical protein